MLSKCTRVIFILTCLKYVRLYECNATGIMESPSSSSDTEETNAEFGYKNHEVTHGLGFGHYLHPFYYQGRAQRSYNCAIAEEWKPYLTKNNENILTVLPVNVDKGNPRDGKQIKPSRKLYVFSRRRNAMSRRNDGNYYNEYSLNPHTTFIKDINSMSEGAEHQHKYINDPRVKEITIPHDAEIIIVKKQQLVENLVPQTVQTYPDSLFPQNYDSTNYIERNPLKWYAKRPTTMKPVIQIVQKINKPTYPNKLVSKFSQDLQQAENIDPYKYVRLPVPLRNLNPIAQETSFSFPIKYFNPQENNENYNKQVNQFAQEINQESYAHKNVNQMAMEINKAIHPYKFVDPYDDLRSKYYTNPQQQQAASSEVVYKMKHNLVNPALMKKIRSDNMSFWEKFVLNFFRLAK